jgi:radical SAM family uncharacterized protein
VSSGRIQLKEGKYMRSDLREILMNVRKPGRYTGGEINSAKKHRTDKKLRFALAFPDIYEVGMSYLGIKILYHLLNEREDICCERVFAPWTDMEQALREKGMPLMSLENKVPLREFDVIGFSLSYELNYSNVLNMLDLGGVPVLSEDRTDTDPIVIAGGACAFNPEPMSPFIDAFAIGDGEEIINEIADIVRGQKKKNFSRKRALKELSAIGGVYVPSFYRADLSSREQLTTPLVDWVPEVIRKRTVSDLDKAYYPVKQVVPLIKTVHDRMTVEIMRGCPNGCRFCQANFINRPVRLRSVEKIRELCTETIKNTGYENISLLSLSSVNYPRLVRLIEALSGDFPRRSVGISIPSLKVDEAFYDLPGMISRITKAGLTFAPESPDPCIRESICKDIDMDVLARSARLAFDNGWKRLKLYFMAGFPGENEDVADGIISLGRQISSLRGRKRNRRAEIRISVNPFMSKPHTPLQWVGMKSPDHINRLRDKLISRSTKKVRVDFAPASRFFLEAAFSRGDRRLGPVIYSAWKKGARLNAWSDHYDHSLWAASFSEHGLSIEEYACRWIGRGSSLAWGHISAGIPEGHLLEGYDLSSFRERVK